MLLGLLLGKLIEFSLERVRIKFDFFSPVETEI